VSAPQVLGLDLSLTSTGVATPDGETHRVTTNAADPLEVRLAHIVEAVSAAFWAGDVRPDLVVIEDLPKNARAAGMTGPVHGAVRLWLHNAQAVTVMVTAASVKKYATGSGNAPKTDLALAALKRAGLEFDRNRDDECDAWWLRALALDAYGHPVVAMPASQREALEKVRWPELARVAS
jgi:Holliday junction resolvasome RuvABC endonuclease subunit